MGIVQLLKIIGPVKFILLALFLILPFIELLDGVFSHSDLFSFVVLFLLLNDLFNDIKRAFIPKVNPNKFSNEWDLELWPNVIGARKINSINPSDLFYCNKGALSNRTLINQERGIVPNKIDKSVLFAKAKSRIFSISLREKDRIKSKMNMFFAALCLSPLLLEYINVEQRYQDRFFLICMMMWSVVLLNVTLREYKFKKVRLVYCNLAFWTFIISVFSW